MGVFMRVLWVENRRSIEKGKHYPDRTHWPLKLFRGDSLTIKRMITFNETAIYRFNDADDGDKNKLFGVSMRFFPVIRKLKSFEGKNIYPWFKLLGLAVFKPQHWSSIRIAWNCQDRNSSIRIYKYAYDKGERTRSDICEIPINKPAIFIINVDKQTGVVKILVEYLNKEYRNYAKTEIKGSLYWLLDLYFGGNRPAPHLITIYEEL